MDKTTKSTELAGLLLDLQRNLQRDLTQAINDSVDRAKNDVNERIAELAATQKELRDYQRIANGRLTKVESASVELRKRVDAGASWFSSLSKQQKARYAAAGAVVLPIAIETLHRAVPILLAWLVKASGVPPQMLPSPQSPPAQTRELPGEVRLPQVRP